MKKLFLSLSVICCSAIYAQDIHFSQTAQTPLFINPGAAGVYDGWERVIVNHRNQWLGAGTQFMTTAIAADANFGKSRNNDKAHLGLGVLFYNDIGGDSRFGIQTGALTLSGILPLGNSGHILSAGIQGGAGNRSADFRNLLFASQWTGTAFDQTLATGEENGNNFFYVDASAGIYYTFNGEKNSFRRNDAFKFSFGVAGYHLNRPMLRYTTVDGDRMYRKFVAHASVVSDIQNTNLSVDGTVAQFFQGPHLETLLGAMLRYRFINGTKLTGYSQDAYVGFGAYYRLRDAVIPSVMINWNGFQFGISYDVTVSSMRKAYRGGSLEFSLSYTNLSHALFKSRRRR